MINRRKFFSIVSLIPFISSANALPKKINGIIKYRFDSYWFDHLDCSYHLTVSDDIIKDLNAVYGLTIEDVFAMYQESIGFMPKHVPVYYQMDGMVFKFDYSFSHKKIDGYKNKDMFFRISKLTGPVSAVQSLLFDSQWVKKNTVDSYDTSAAIYMKRFIPT